MRRIVRRARDFYRVSHDILAGGVGPDLEDAHQRYVAVSLAVVSCASGKEPHPPDCQVLFRAPDYSMMAWKFFGTSVVLPPKFLFRKPLVVRVYKYWIPTPAMSG